MHGSDVVLHLHSFQDKEDIALFDGLAGLDFDFLDHARDRSGDGVAAGSRGRSGGSFFGSGRSGSRSSLFDSIGHQDVTMGNRVAFTDIDCLDFAILQGSDVVLHLHGFENKENVTLLYGLAGFDIDFLDHTRDRGGHGFTAFNEGCRGSCGNSTGSISGDGEFGSVHGDDHRISFGICDFYGKSFSVNSY